MEYLKFSNLDKSSPAPATGRRGTNLPTSLDTLSKKLAKNANIRHDTKTSTEISSLSSKRYTPLWTMLDSSSDFRSSLKINRNVGRVDFTIDVYRTGQEARSFDVACFMTLSEVDTLSSCAYPHPGDAIIVRQGHSAQWMRLDDANLSLPRLSLSLPEMLKSLLTQAAQIPLLAPPQITQENPKITIACKQGLKDILMLWNDGELESSENLLEEFKRCIANNLSVSAVREFIQERQLDPEITSAIFRSISDVASEFLHNGLKDLLLDFSLASKSSIRYAAIEALSYHMDSKIKSILSVRLKSEKNRSVAALISASID